MPDYSKGKIYRISAGDLTYYGSTTQLLCNRMGQHRKDFRLNKGYASALVLQQDPEAKIVWVEDYPCENKEQLNAREQYYQDNYPCVNKNKAYTGLSEAEYQAQYRQDNAERLKARHTCECGGCYTHQKKSQHLRTQKHQEHIKILQS